MQMYDPVVICATCGETGHTTASCHYTRAEYMSDMSYEDEVFWSYIDPRDRPESLREVDSDEIIEGSPRYSTSESEEDSDTEEVEDSDMIEESEESNDEMEVEANSSEEEGLGSCSEKEFFDENYLYSNSESDSDIELED